MNSAQSAYVIFAVPATLISIALSVSVEVSSAGQQSESFISLREQPLASLTQSAVFIQTNAHQMEQVDIDLVSEKLKPEGHQKFADSKPATQESNPSSLVVERSESQTSNATYGDTIQARLDDVKRRSLVLSEKGGQDPPKQSKEHRESVDTDPAASSKSSANRLLHRSAVVIGVICAFAGLQAQPRAAVLMSI